MCVLHFSARTGFCIYLSKISKRLHIFNPKQLYYDTKNEKAENSKNAKYHSVLIFILLMCVVLIILTQVTFKEDTVKKSYFGVKLSL